MLIDSHVLDVVDLFDQVVIGIATLLSPQQRSRNGAKLAQIVKTIRDGEVGDENVHHKNAFLCLYHGEAVKACALWEMGILFNPHDILAIRCAQFSYETIGDKTNVLGVVQRVLPQWENHAAGYSRMLGMLGYGQQLNDQVNLAEETIGRALNISLDNVFATYALVQAYERSCRHREGLRTLQELSDTWTLESPLRDTLLTYKAIFHSQVGDYALALHILDGEATQRIENASLLWRLELMIDEDMGQPVTTRSGLMQMFSLDDEQFRIQMPDFSPRYAELLQHCSLEQAKSAKCLMTCVHLVSQACSRES